MARVPKRKLFDFYEVTAAESALAQAADDPVIVEGAGSRVGRRVPGTGDIGGIPSPAPLLPPISTQNTIFPSLDKSGNPTILSPRAQGLLGDKLQGIQSVRRKAKASIMESMSLEDIFGELITSYKVPPNIIIQNIKGMELSEPGTGRMIKPSEATLKDHFSSLLAWRRIRPDLDIPEM
jgi:hypothetical protein